MPNFDNTLKSYKRKGNVSITHTRIPSKNKKIYGGSYHVPTDELDNFHNKYYKAVISGKRPEYLTETQLVNGGAILEDFDFRYSTDIDYRVHTEEHIDDIIELYMEKLLEIYNMTPGSSFPIFIFQKDDVNVKENVTKDGIHMIIGIKSDKFARQILRNKILDNIGLIFEELNLQNSYEEVLDEGISKGSTKWQMYGSKKPDNEPYKLTHHYQININTEDDEEGPYELEVQKATVTRELFSKISAQYPDHISYELQEQILSVYNKVKKNGGGKSIKNYKHPKNKKFNQMNNISSDMYKDIKSEEELDAAIEDWFSQINAEDYVLYETHKFLMILSQPYYNQFEKWLKVGLALHNIKLKHQFHDQKSRMFLSWMKFSSQWKDFDWDSDIAKHWQTWSNFTYKENTDGLSEKSIMWWAQECDKGKYKEIKDNTVDYYIYKSQSYGKTAHDIAMVAYQLYKDKFRCVSIKRNEWYEYKNGRWKPLDRGTTLRKSLSTEISGIYSRKTWEEKEKLTALADQNAEEVKNKVPNVCYNNSSEGQQQEEINKLKSKNQNTKTPIDQAVMKKMKTIHALSDISVMLKQTSSKNNIMTECCELFYEEGFEEKLDANPYLFCCKNGVIDFKEKIFRPGRAEDYCSLCNNLVFKKESENTSTDDEYLKNVNTFMEQLFPNEELRTYMWEHLASGLIGTNDNQTFNIYNGCGRNGKSMLVKFMIMILGDYKGSVPLQYITQKRPTAGAASPDIAALKGVRYAVIQEPEKAAPLNEGIMKELTGGDEITARKLFSDIIKFTPQFSLVVCTNHLFDIKSNDDGTWRRIRICDFKSKFVAKPSKKEDDFEFLIDKKLDDKLNKWKYMFLQKLVEVAFKTGGLVEDCDPVLELGRKYRKKQDFFTEYFEERIIKAEVDTMMFGKQEVFDDFRQWFNENHGKNTPKGQELYEFLNKKIGVYKKKGWWGYKINYTNTDVVELTANEIE
tara:strand:- start:10909 stop:13818 length:2910 start_codon:yes stop_codon:yes gene_type:complete